MKKVIQKFRKYRGRTLVVCLSLLFLALINDLSVWSGGYDFFYIREYFYIIILMVLTLMASRYFSDAEKINVALDQAENKYRLIAENSADVIWTMDLDFNFTYLSPSVYQLRGYTVEESANQPFEERVPGALEKLTDLFNEKMAAIQSGDPKGWEPVMFELKQYHKDGRAVWTSNNARILPGSDNQPQSIIGITRDITDRVLADQALKENEKKYRHLFEFSMDGVLLADPEKGYLDCNLAALKLFGLDSKKQFVELTLGDLSPQYQPDGVLSSEKIINRLKTVFTTGSDLFEWTYKRQDGEVFYASVLVALIKIGERNIHQVTIRDMSEYKRTQEAMVQSEKMMSVGGLAAGMAHEINNPLAGMMQTADVIAKRLWETDIPANRQAAEEIGIDMDDIRAYMEKREILKLFLAIKESGGRVASIVRNMLSFARKSDAMVSSHNLCDLFEKTIELACTDINLKHPYDFKSIKIHKAYDAHTSLVPCESSKIQQVLLNILRNGVQAMQTAQTPNPLFKVRIQAEHEQNTVCLEIEDNGPGMDEKTRKRVFEPFFTTKPVGGGTGLGLSVSYFIIKENHGGEMHVVSRPGRGTTFIIRLPLEHPRQIGEPAAAQYRA